MKYFTVPLVNQRKKGWKTIIFGQSAEQKHYRAQHRSEDITLLWLEASQFGKLHCFPCVLKEGDDMLVFRSASSRQNAEDNAMLVQRWNLFVNPENIQTDFHVEEMDKREFYKLFNECQRQIIEDFDRPRRAAVQPAPIAEEGESAVAPSQDGVQADQAESPEEAGSGQQ